MKLDTPLTQVSGIGPALGTRLAKLNLFKVSDLIYHFPYRYDDYSKITKISQIQEGERVTLKGQIWQIKNAYTRFGKVLTKAIFNDGSASIELVWFNQPYLTKSIQSGDELNIAGTVSKFGNKLSISAPDWEKIEKNVHTGRLVPIYPQTSRVTSKWFRNQLAKTFPELKQNLVDFLPPEIQDGMIAENEALEKIHFPTSQKDIDQARERLAFDEIFLIQLATLQIRALWSQQKLVEPWKIDNHLNTFTKSLPFDLTNAQNRVLSEITNDLAKNKPMNRLVQGEVGSGKTVVAAAAMYLAHLNGFQSLFMAPTEILAWQHYATIKRLLEPFGINVGIYTGSRKHLEGKAETVKGKVKNTKKLHASRFTVTPSIIVGTHAILSDKINPEKVGLVIIDEQHRFGVEHRTLLRQKGVAPHLLSMTATPIPRTVALTMYGDLDLSIIDELPKNRPLIKTHLVPEKKREDAYKFITKKLQEGDQIYVVTPLIEESLLPEDFSSFSSAKAAKIEHEKLQKKFAKYNVGLLHGKMKAKEKEEVLEAFRTGKIQVLVATSVVEVGVDVPNATIMVIEGAEHFGLAQLHQLRGRVGRGVKESFCLLFTEKESTTENRRLKYLEKTFDGLKLAELDLKIRGAGTIFGVSQHGRFDLQIAKLNNLELIEKAKSSAEKLLQDDPTLDKYPQLQAKLSSLATNVMPD